MGKRYARETGAAMNEKQQRSATRPNGAREATAAFHVSCEALQQTARRSACSIGVAGHFFPATMKGDRPMEVTLHNGERVQCEKLALMAWADAGAEVDRRTRALVAKYPGRAYSEAMHIVLDEDEALKRAYAEEPLKASREARDPAVRFSDGSSIPRDSFRNAVDADAEIDRLTKLKLKADPRLSYATACRQVLDAPENKELKVRYAFEGGGYRMAG
jgi:hypothetical protein